MPSCGQEIGLIVIAGQLCCNESFMTLDMSTTCSNLC